MSWQSFLFYYPSFCTQDLKCCNAYDTRGALLSKLLLDALYGSLVLMPTQGQEAIYASILAVPETARVPR